MVRLGRFLAVGCATAFAACGSGDTEPGGAPPGALADGGESAVGAGEDAGPGPARRDASADAGPSGPSWKPLRIGAGGFLVGMDIAADGTKVVRTDTYGAYLWSGSSWTQLVTAQRMPSDFVTTEKNEGVYELRIAPSDTSRFYMTYLGYVFRSDDRGSTWTKTGFIKVPANPNDDYRTYGAKTAIDPANKDVVYVGTPSSGLFRTTDGGASWAAVSAIPVAKDAGYTGMTFDPKSGVTGGRTNIAYAAVWKDAVWRTKDAGATWTRTTGGPTTVEHGVVAPDGVYYATDGSASGGAWKLVGDSWTKLESSRPWHAVAVDPSDAARVVVIDGGGNMRESLDRGATWTGEFNAWAPSMMSLAATDIPWLAWTNESFLTAGDIRFDPPSGKLLFSQGIGVWNTTFPKTLGTFTWTSQSLGIEQLVANRVVAPPGGKPIVASWDRALFRVEDPDVFPSQHGVNRDHAIVAGWDVDYDVAAPQNMVAVVNWYGIEQSSTSSDGGKTWQRLPSVPAWPSSPLGGCIAMASSKNMVWVTSGDQAPYSTQDGGASWKKVVLPGVPDTSAGWGGLFGAYYLNRHIVTADRVKPSTFYLFHPGRGVFATTDGGVTWTQTASIVPVSLGIYNARLDAVPGKAGHLFLTAGQLDGPNPSGSFMHSTDGGVTWKAVPDVLEVNAFGFGATTPGAAYPSLYIAGYVKGAYGIWQSDDEGITWTSIGDWPLGSLDKVVTVDGDKAIPGQVYVGFSGSGYAYRSMK